MAAPRLLLALLLDDHPEAARPWDRALWPASALPTAGLAASVHHPLDVERRALERGGGIFASGAAAPTLPPFGRESFGDANDQALSEALETDARRFFSKVLLTKPGVPIRAHASVHDGALHVAADRVARALRQQPESVLARLRKSGACVHVIGEGQR